MRTDWLQDETDQFFSRDMTCLILNGKKEQGNEWRKTGKTIKMDT